MRCRETRRKWGWSIVYYVWLWTWFFLHNYINSCQSRGIMHSNPEASGFRTGAEFKHFFLSTSNFAEIFQLKIDKWQTLCCKTHICAIYQANFFLVQCCIYRSNLRSPGSLPLFHRSFYTTYHRNVSHEESHGKQVANQTLQEDLAIPV